MNLPTAFLLDNSVQPYQWGHREAIARLFSVSNPQHQPQAEIWMGAHPKAPSKVIMPGGFKKALNELIADMPEYILGKKISQRYNARLPFLLKVLSAAKPLSIQTHPNQQQAREGFARENNQGIALDAPNRNYRDDNHKPELIYALTPFKAMNGFRDIQDILQLFTHIQNPALHLFIDELSASPNAQGLKVFYQKLMTLEEFQRLSLIKAAVKAAKRIDDAGFQELLHLHQDYPNDIGVLSPLLLNLVILAPGQAMFLKAGTLHAYMEGTGLEVMANSDNVLRGGLTGKHVDIDELLNTVEFVPLPPQDIQTQPQVCGAQTCFDVPVNDFTFSIIRVMEHREEYACHCAEILFCVGGNIAVHTRDGQSLLLVAGQACLIAAASKSYALSGLGMIARTSAGHS